jgi:hypothetical protein
MQGTLQLRVFKRGLSVIDPHRSLAADFMRRRLPVDHSSRRQLSCSVFRAIPLLPLQQQQQQLMSVVTIAGRLPQTVLIVAVHSRRLLQP